MNTDNIINFHHPYILYPGPIDNIWHHPPASISEPDYLEETMKRIQEQAEKEAIQDLKDAGAFDTVVLVANPKFKSQIGQMKFAGAEIAAIYTDRMDGVYQIMDPQIRANILLDRPIIP